VQAKGWKMQGSKSKKPPEGGFSPCSARGARRDHLAALAPEAGASAAEAALVGASGAEAAGAGAATGAGAGAGASSFLPQAVRAKAATTDAKTKALFM
jgi:hypothetical protein